MERLRSAATTALLIGGLWTVLAAVGAASGALPLGGEQEEDPPERDRDGAERGTGTAHRGASGSADEAGAASAERDGAGALGGGAIGPGAHSRAGGEARDGHPPSEAAVARRHALCPPGQHPSAPLRLGQVVGEGPPELLLGCGGALHVLSLVRSTDGPVPVRIATYRAKPPGEDMQSVAGAAAAGDVDGDGRPDLVIPFSFVSARGGSRSGRVALVRTRAERAFAPPRVFAHTHARAVQMADLDGHGGLDVVVVDRGRPWADQRGEVRVFRGAANPRPSSRLEAGKRAAAVAVVDLNRDAHPDVVVGSRERVDVHYGGPRGRTERSQRFDATAAAALVVGDVDGDGHDDVVADDEPPKLIRAGSGELHAEGLSSSRSESGRLHVRQVVDVDGDGRADLLAVRGSAVVALEQREALFFRERPILQLPGATLRDAWLGDLLGGDAPELVAVARSGASDGAAAGELLIAADASSWPVRVAADPAAPIEAVPMAVDVELP